MLIRFIMWMTRGPTDPGAVVEFTDWQRVDAFGHALCARMVEQPRPHSDAERANHDEDAGYGGDPLSDLA
jgi:hypothetical protein